MSSTGGCLCGSLRYAAEGEPALVGKCYCADCQKETGTGHMTFVAFSSDAIGFTGERKEYVQKGSSGVDVVRVFCPSCGTTVVGYPKVMGNVAAVRAGTLDDAVALVPTMAVFCRSAQGWDSPPAGVALFETMPID